MSLPQTALGPHKPGTARHRHGQPPSHKAAPLSYSMIRREQMVRMIDDMQKQGVVQPSSSVVLVPKKDGTTRICVDY